VGWGGRFARAEAGELARSFFGDCFGTKGVLWHRLVGLHFGEEDIIVVSQEGGEEVLDYGGVVMLVDEDLVTFIDYSLDVSTLVGDRKTGVCWEVSRVADRTEDL
jgi:hypothetical protein